MCAAQLATNTWNDWETDLLHTEKRQILDIGIRFYEPTLAGPNTKITTNSSLSDDMDEVTK